MNNILWQSSSFIWRCLKGCEKHFINFHPSPWRWHHDSYNYPSITWRAEMFLENKRRHRSQLTAKLIPQASEGWCSKGADQAWPCRAPQGQPSATPCEGRLARHPEGGGQQNRHGAKKRPHKCFTKFYKILGEYPIFLIQVVVYKSSNLASQRDSAALGRHRAHGSHSLWAEPEASCSQMATWLIHVTGPGPIGSWRAALVKSVTLPVTGKLLEED